MADDWLMGEDEVDEDHVRLALAANEQKKLKESQYNAGYLEGLEWAEANHKTVDISNDEKLNAILD